MPQPDQADLFLGHAAATMPRAPKRRAKKKVPEALAKKNAEKGRLLLRYAAAWQRLRQEMISSAPIPEAFEHLLRECDEAGADDGPNMIAVAEAGSTYGPEHRQFLLSTIAAWEVRVRRAAGLEPFDDPLPWDAETNTFIDAKRILRVA